MSVTTFAMLGALTWQVTKIIKETFLCPRGEMVRGFSPALPLPVCCACFSLSLSILSIVRFISSWYRIPGHATYLCKLQLKSPSADQNCDHIYFLQTEPSVILIPLDILELCAYQMKMTMTRWWRRRRRGFLVLLSLLWPWPLMDVSYFPIPLKIGSVTKSLEWSLLSIQMYILQSFISRMIN